MNRILNRLLIIVFATLVLSCGKESSCLKSSGNIKTELRALTTPITKIKIADNINLILTQSNQNELKVEAGDNLLPYINTGVNGETLEISNGNKCNFLRSYDKPVNVYLSVPNLIEIAYEGKGNISNTGILNFPKLTIESRSGTGDIELNIVSDQVRLLSHAGATKFTLTGSANNLFVYSGASTWCYLSALSANIVHVNNAGAGDVMVNSNTSLLVELTSLGSIIYSGNPTVTVGVHSGSGQLIKK